MLLADLMPLFAKITLANAHSFDKFALKACSKRVARFIDFRFVFIFSFSRVDFVSASCVLCVCVFVFVHDLFLDYFNEIISRATLISKCIYANAIYTYFNCTLGLWIWMSAIGRFTKTLLWEQCFRLKNLILSNSAKEYISHKFPWAILNPVANVTVPVLVLVLEPWHDSKKFKNARTHKFAQIEFVYEWIP